MIILKYWNAKLQIAMLDWRTVYQFPQKEKLLLELHQNRIYYRAKGSTKRISYTQLKMGLIKRQIILTEEPLPF
jgi:hypothetical protein